MARRKRNSSRPIERDEHLDKRLDTGLNERFNTGSDSAGSGQSIPPEFFSQPQLPPVRVPQVQIPQVQIPQVQIAPAQIPQVPQAPQVPQVPQVQVPQVSQIPQVQVPQIPATSAIPSVPQFSYGGQMGSSTSSSDNIIDINYQGISNLAYQLSQHTPIPPFANLEPTKESLKIQKPKRSRRRSKFTQEQDDMIISMKKAGKSWVEIAESTGVGSYLAARNRYQVLVGQQGGRSMECGPEDVQELRGILDEGELVKWSFLAKELSKVTRKEYTPEQVRELLRYLFWKNPETFDVNEKYLMELLRLQEEQQGEVQEHSQNTGFEGYQQYTPQFPQYQSSEQQIQQQQQGQGRQGQEQQGQNRPQEQ
ncbi:DEKNAAC105151 [Brettanomyces naardenensis]|uniref:DEKNAAC105151 n=1 Tax=Brettanomyces naardenensis TaxID=13370 RepID=A0A448YSL5_BRENA|nr:DEKNAAC105151 [Brettanomyces naardenensis]